MYREEWPSDVALQACRTALCGISAYENRKNCSELWKLPKICCLKTLNSMGKMIKIYVYTFCWASNKLVLNVRGEHVWLRIVDWENF